MSIMRNFPRLCLFLACALVLAGCGSGTFSEELRVARDVVTGNTDRNIKRADAETLYNTARGFLDSGDPQRALEVYDELETLHPFSDFATQAQLEIIYAHHKAFQPESALAAADRFIKQHPSHPEIDYVYYLRGLINYDRSVDRLAGFLWLDGSSRDPGFAKQSFSAFNLLIQRFPNSAYNRDARLRMIELRNRIASNELVIAEYYLRRGAWVAASRRAQYIIDHYQGTDSLPRALAILEQSYRKLELEVPANNARAILMASYPGYVEDPEAFKERIEDRDTAYDYSPVTRGRAGVPPPRRGPSPSP